MSPIDEIEAVRDKTTKNTSKLTDDKIQQYLLEHAHHSRKARILLAAAECIEFLNRDVTWQSQTLGSQSASGNLMLDRAKDYRRQAALLEPFII
jgi:hypothetical protein